MRFLFALVVVATCLIPLQAFAHSGCCSWHGGVAYCDTSVGTYVCNDGSYSPSCGCAYYPPAPVCAEATIGKSGDWTFVKNGCNQDVYFTWDKGSNDDFYSVAISKTRGADPGPKADTSTASYTFRDIKPGKWYINVKPGRSCGWGGVYNWTVTIPEVKPEIYFNESIISESERALNYSASCAQKVEIDQGIGKVNKTTGTFVIHPTDNTLYTLTATNGSVVSSSSIAVEYPLPKPEEKIQPIVTSQEENNRSDEAGNFDRSLLWWALAGGTGLWAGRKYLLKSIS